MLQSVFNKNFLETRKKDEKDLQTIKTVLLD